MPSQFSVPSHLLFEPRRDDRLDADPKVFLMGSWMRGAPRRFEHLDPESSSPRLRASA